MSGPVRVEAATRHALAYCRDCVSFRELRGTRVAAQLAAADHLERVHGATKAARELRKAARRAATPS